MPVATVMFLRNTALNKTVDSWEVEVRETGATVDTNESTPSVNKESVCYLGNKVGCFLVHHCWLLNADEIV